MPLAFRRRCQQGKDDRVILFSSFYRSGKMEGRLMSVPSKRSEDGYITIFRSIVTRKDGTVVRAKDLGVKGIPIRIKVGK